MEKIERNQKEKEGQQEKEIRILHSGKRPQLLLSNFFKTKSMMVSSWTVRKNDFIC